MRSFLILLLAFLPLLSLAQRHDVYETTYVWNCPYEQDHKNWIKDGCKGVEMPGRFEFISGKPTGRIVHTIGSEKNQYRILDERESDRGHVIIARHSKGGKWDRWEFIINEERGELMIIKGRDRLLIFDVTKKK